MCVPGVSGQLVFDLGHELLRLLPPGLESVVWELVSSLALQPSLMKYKAHLHTHLLLRRVHNTRKHVALWRVVVRFYARIDLSSILVTALRPCRINDCVYCEPAFTLSRSYAYNNTHTHTHRTEKQALFLEQDVTSLSLRDQPQPITLQGSTSPSQTTSHLLTEALNNLSNIRSTCQLALRESGMCSHSKLNRSE